METKDVLLLCSCACACVAIFWRTIFGEDKKMREWAEKEFVRKEMFELHMEQFGKQMAKMHEDNRADRSADRALLIEIVQAVGGKIPPPQQSRRDRPSDPGRPRG